MYPVGDYSPISNKLNFLLIMRLCSRIIFFLCLYTERIREVYKHEAEQTSGINWLVCLHLCLFTVYNNLITI